MDEESCSQGGHVSDASDTSSQAGSGKKQHPRGGGAKRSHGDQYHKYLAMLIIFRLFRAACEFEIALEYEPGGKFDDIYFKFKNEQNNWEEIFLQAKHSSKEKGDFTIKDLLEKPSRKRGNPLFLLDYFSSYNKIPKKCEDIRHFVLFTNKLFSFGQTYKDFLMREDMFDDCKIAPDVFQSSFKKFKLNAEQIECFNSILFDDIDKLTSEQFENFLYELCIADGQYDVKLLHSNIKNEILEYCSEGKFESDNIYYRFYCWVDEWYYKLEGSFIDKKEVKDFFEQCSEKPLKHVYFNVMDPNSYYTGRDEELTKLKVEMTKNTKGKSIKCVVNGMAGVGKSEFVLKYINMYKHDYDHILWINAESKNTIQNSFADLGIQLKILSSTEKKNEKEQVLLVYEFFKTKGKCLFVFDNAVEFKSEFDTGIQNFMPKVTSESDFQFVVTSQTKFWTNFCDKVITLEAFDATEVVDFFEKSFSGIQHSEEEIHKLAAELNNFPLACQLAASFIKENVQYLKILNLNYSITDYLESYRSDTSEFLQYKFSSVETTNYSKSLFKTWKMAIDSIQRRDKGKEAIKLLCGLVYCEPDNIPNIMFLNMPGINNKLLLGAMFSLIDSFSLIKLDSGFCFIHRIIQDVIRQSLRSNEKQNAFFGPELNLSQEVVLENLLILFKHDIDTNEKKLALYKMSKYFLNHAINVWKHASTYEKFSRKYSDLPEKILNDLIEDNKNSVAETFVDYNLGVISETFGEVSEQFVRMKILKSQVLESHGAYDEGLLIINEVLQDVDAKMYDNSQLKSMALYVKAVILHEKGNSIEALQICNDIIPAIDHIYENINLETIKKKQLKALILEKIAKYKEAFDVQNEILSIGKKLVANHPLVLRTESRIASLFYRQGDYENALKLYDEVYPKERETLGENHLCTIFTMHNRAINLEELGKLEEALKSYLEVHEKLVMVRGSEKHHDVLMSKRRIASIYRKRGENLEALEIYEKVLERELATIPDHSSTFYTTFCKAEILELLGRSEEAIQIFEDVLQKRIKKFTKDHPHTLTSMHKKACLLRDEGKVQEAIELLQEVLEIRTNVLTASHKLTLETLTELNKLREQK